VRIGRIKIIQGKELKEAIVLAGGFGTRLREMVPNCPKPMAMVAGRPFLEILLMALSKKGFTRVVISLGYLSEKIISHFKSQYAGMDLTYVVEDHPLGTGGAVRLAMTHCLNDYVFVFNGDTFLDIESKEIEMLWVERRNPIIVAKMVTDTSRYGSLLVKNNSIIGFTEKGKTGPGLINAGCYLFSTNVLDDYVLNESFSLEHEFLKLAVKKKSIEVYVTKGQFIDIGIPEDYLRAQTELADR
jgi:D-glycero-alpha-D-manno-heptose 1-phosphate guanylyltransferase